MSRPHQLIRLDPLTRATSPVDGYPVRRSIGDPATWSAPDGYAYVPIFPRPSYDAETQNIVPHLTLEGDGWMVESAQGQPAQSESAILSELDALFEALPAEVQAMFEPAWTTVRNLMQAGKSVRAYNFVAALTVPESLEATKAAILEKLAG
jgi:hypothetical protein